METQGIRGKQGPTGSRGAKGLKGEVGGVGSRGAKGDTGRMGLLGLLDLKKTKETGALLAFKDQKENVLLLQKYPFFRVSVCVCIYRSATFYCWAQGQSVNKITWRKQENDSLRDIRTTNGILHISDVQRSHAGSYLCAGFTSYGIF